MAKRTNLTNYLSKKNVKCQIGSIQLEKEIAEAVEFFLKNDRSLFEIILTDALQEKGIVDLAKEYKDELETNNTANK
jgi:hypothetical protein